MLDTNILILRSWINPAELPEEMTISAITLAELSAGPHQVRPNAEQSLYDEHAERARRLEILQRAESEFDPVPFDAEAARIFGRVTAAVVAAGRKPRRRTADLMIAATAIAEGLPLFTTNPDDFAGLDRLMPIIPVTRPVIPHQQRALALHVLSYDLLAHNPPDSATAASISAWVIWWHTCHRPLAHLASPPKPHVRAAWASASECPWRVAESSPGGGGFRAGEDPGRGEGQQAAAAEQAKGAPAAARRAERITSGAGAGIPAGDTPGSLAAGHGGLLDRGGSTRALRR